MVGVKGGLVGWRGLSDGLTGDDDDDGIATRAVCAGVERRRRIGSGWGCLDRGPTDGARAGRQHHQVGAGARPRAGPPPPRRGREGGREKKPGPCTTYSWRRTARIQIDESTPLMHVGVQIGTRKPRRPAPCMARQVPPVLWRQ